MEPWLLVAALTALYWLELWWHMRERSIWRQERLALLERIAPGLHVGETEILPPDDDFGPGDAREWAIEQRRCKRAGIDPDDLPDF